MKTTTILKRLKGIPNVENLTSPRSYEPVKNQFIIKMDNGTVFQSYDSTIAIEIDGKIYVTKDYNYSRTTSKYLNQFCGYTAKEVEKELDKKGSKFVMLK